MKVSDDGLTQLHKHMKKIQSILGLTAGVLLAVAATGCDSSDSGGGGGNPGGGSGSKVSGYPQPAPAGESLAGGSGTKPSQPSSEPKTNTPSGGSGTKTNSPSGDSGPKGE